MGGVGKSPEHRIRCLPSLTKSGGDEVLRFELDGKECGVSIKINNFQRSLVEGLPPRTLDLLEIAALVYGADASVSRGGPVLQQTGAAWYRRFKVEMPVRDHAFWTGDDIGVCLEALLQFLGDDRYRFEFVPKTDPDAERNRFFRFSSETAWRPDRILMFSGGLDSFAGALEEIIDRRQRVALISHSSASKLAPVQQKLYREMSERLGAANVHHLPVVVQMAGRGLKEGTHRSRSFLFAALGAIAAQAFDLDRVSFHENGVVSLNLPILGNVLGTRATRTTHPQTLANFTRFLGLVYEGRMRIDNPSFWKTKTDVVQTIDRLQMADLIGHTHSCADVHNRTKQFHHCGRCSQCIDRRFAILASEKKNDDPGDAYRVDLLDGARTEARDREIALAYVRDATKMKFLTPDLLVRAYPQVLDAVRGFDEPESTVLMRITELLKRHGAAVAGVMDAALRRAAPETYPSDSLPRLYGDAERDFAFGSGFEPETIDTGQEGPSIMEIDERRKIITFDRVVEVHGPATFRLLHELGKANLEGAGKGMNPFDYPLLSAVKLARLLDLESDEGVRQSVARVRGELGRRFTSAGRDREEGRNLIENVHGQGYRLAPDLVTVRHRTA